MKIFDDWLIHIFKKNVTGIHCSRRLSFTKPISGYLIGKMFPGKTALIFFAVAADVMRKVLIDHARRKKAAKRN
ncbi:ECF-type sigma factor, partial [Escherichia coli]|nr:ECF-type sigma factor [Escherichia coli]